MIEPDGTQTYDLFVSYAHVDNEDGWVDQFVTKLRAALRMRNGGQPLRIYFDNSEVYANNLLDDMIHAARNSKLFLVVGSRAYVERPFTMRELTAFDEEAKDPRRIFVIETLPLVPGKEWPGPIREHTRQSFFCRDEINETAYPLSPEAEATRFQSEVRKLAEQIVYKLASMSSAEAPKTRAKPAPAVQGLEHRRVLIAQPTESLDEAADQLRNFLEKFDQNIEILPKSPYPQGGAEFKASFLLDLDRSDLVVQLLDRRPGRRPPDLPEGYTMFQWNAARTHGVEIMQWRHPDIELGEVADVDYRRMLQEQTVTACGFQEFMAAVGNRARDQVAKDRPKNGAVVYVHASRPDLDMARRIGKNCGKYKLFCHLPSLDAKTMNTEEVKKRLATSNAVLFLYCHADVGWARAEAEEVHKHRRSEQVIALCLGPPPDKPEMNVVFPDARIIESDDEEEFLRQIDSLLEELAA